VAAQKSWQTTTHLWYNAVECVDVYSNIYIYIYSRVVCALLRARLCIVYKCKLERKETLLTLRIQFRLTAPSNDLLNRRWELLERAEWENSSDEKIMTISPLLVNADGFRLARDFSTLFKGCGDETEGIYF
jgi:hypothetical protein